MNVTVSKEFINENKKEIKEGLSKLQDKYIEDNKIFDKINFLLETYTKRSSWPFSVDEFLDTTEEILGYDYIKFITFYKGYMQHEELRTDLNLNEKFKLELNFFSEIIGNLVLPAMSGKENCFKLHSIHSSEISNGIIVVNFTRNDNEGFKFEADLETLKGLKNFIEDVVEDFKEK